MSIAVKGSNDLVLNADNRSALVELSGMMAQAQGAVPAWLIGNQGGCFAIAMQAASWNMNPFIVAQKSFQIKGNIGYEAQLVNAVVCASGSITSRFKYDFVGDWASKQNAGVRVGAILLGEREITWGHIHYLADVAVKNSPLWKTNPQQQIGYLATKNWARMYTPDALLGVYSKDELEGDETVIISKEEETEKVVAAKKAIAGCPDSEYLDKLIDWIAGFDDSDKAVLQPLINELKDRFQPIVEEFDI